MKMFRKYEFIMIKRRIKNHWICKGVEWILTFFHLQIHKEDRHAPFRLREYNNYYKLVLHKFICYIISEKYRLETLKQLFFRIQNEQYRVTFLGGIFKNNYNFIEVLLNSLIAWKFTQFSPNLWIMNISLWIFEIQ